MIVIQSDDAETVSTNAVLYSRPEAIRKLATMMIVSMAEANTDMICDMAEEYPTKGDVERGFQHLADQALDSLEDHINDLRESLTKFLKDAKVVAKVRRLDYDDDGALSDIMIDLRVE